jgi:hypothetical protein
MSSVDPQEPVDAIDGQPTQPKININIRTIGKPAENSE